MIFLFGVEIFMLERNESERRSETYIFSGFLLFLTAFEIDRRGMARDERKRARERKVRTLGVV